MKVGEGPGMQRIMKRPLAFMRISLIAVALLPTVTSFSFQGERIKSNNNVVCSSSSSRRDLLFKISSAAALSISPVSAASASQEEVGDSSDKFETPKLGGVSIVGWAAAAVIFNDVLSNRFSADSIDGIVPEDDDVARK